MAKRLYIKRSASIEPLNVESGKTDTKQQIVGQKSSPAGYKKKPSFDTPYSLFIIISGGERRERDYFKVIQNNGNLFPRIKIVFIANPNKLDPKGLLEIAKERQEYYSTSESEENPDAYFLVSDVDHFYNDLVGIKKESANKGFNLIISNPCFEVWLYYSKRDDLFEGFVVPDEYLKTSRQIKQWLNTAIPGGVNPTKAIFDIEANISNAKKNYGVDDNGIPLLFATSMIELAEAILPFVKNGLNQMQQ